jgi:hypothetical protein
MTKLTSTRVIIYQLRLDLTLIPTTNAVQNVNKIFIKTHDKLMLQEQQCENDS